MPSWETLVILGTIVAFGIAVLRQVRAIRTDLEKKVEGVDAKVADVRAEVGKLSERLHRLEHVVVGLKATLETWMRVRLEPLGVHPPDRPRSGADG